jgi:cellulose synthase/poly-beta-1,6-N-acetylglucosamine synthase-like glycosyltransferase
LLTFLLIISTLVYGALMLFYAKAWRELPVSELKADYNCSTTVSIIVPARNEAANIKKLLPILLHQRYSGPKPEIIVVNDHSTDNTLEILQSYAADINLINLQDEISPNAKLIAYKKKAIEVAIAKASGTLILTTDADCTMPLSWVESIVQCYETQKPKIIAAPVNYNSTGSLLGIFQSIDFLTMQGITGASIFRHFNSTCNGANMAYSKKVFLEVNGFAGIDHIASGDDMLLLHKIETKYPKGATYLKNENAIVSTDAVPTWSGFLQQRIRWASKAKSYADKRVTAVLGAVYFYNLLLLIAFFMSLFQMYSFTIVILFLAIKIGLELLLLNPVLKFFERIALQKYFIPLQPLHITYMVLVGFLGLFTKYEWKGRSVQ